MRERTDPGPVDFERVGDLLGETGVPPPALPDGPPVMAGAALSPSSRRSRGVPVNGAPGPTGAGADLTRRLAVVWTEVVGPEVAANARPVQLRRGRLVVSASSSAWAQTLQFMSDTIVAGLNERLGAGAVEQAVFRHAGWEERARERRVKSALGGRGASPNEDDGRVAAGEVPLSAEQQAALAELGRLDLAPELREKIARAMRAAFVRAQQDSVR